MCKFLVSLERVDEGGKETGTKLQVEVYGNSVPDSSLEPLFTDKLVSFQVLDHKFFLLNLYQAARGDDVCDRAKRQGRSSAVHESAESNSSAPNQNQNEGEKEKIVQMLHVNKDKKSSLLDDKICSRQDLHTTTTLIPKCTKYIGQNKEKCDPEADSKSVNYGCPLRTVIINLDDWRLHQNFHFFVNTNNDETVTAPSDIILIPFNPAEETTTTTKGENNLEESAVNETPMSMQILVENSLILMLESSVNKLFAPELNNNNHGIISSKKALLVRDKCSESEIALTDEGIPLVPTKKQIVRELVRKRLQSLRMREADCNAFLQTRDDEFIQRRSLSVRLPLITKPNVTTSTSKAVLKPSGTKSKEKTLPSSTSSSPPLSVSFEIEARYQTLVYHSENLNKIVNSATVSAIEGSIYFILPHMTCTKINQVSPSLVDDWLDIIYTAAYQLKPADPSHVQSLVQREMKQVSKAAKELLKNSKKTLIKCKKLNEIVLRKYRKARLPKLNYGYTTTKQRNKNHNNRNDDNNNDHNKSNYDNFPMKKADVGYSRFLHKMGVSASKLYPNHVHIAVGKYGVLLKKNLRDPWFHFDDLNYPERRVIFLGLMEHMQEMIRAVAASIRRIQELYVDGYPANVHSHLKIVFSLIRDMNTGFDLSESMKTNVLAQGTRAVESISRLLQVVHEIYAMAKVSFAKFHSTYYDPDDAQNYRIRKPDNKAARIQLIVPFSALATDGLATLKSRTNDHSTSAENNNNKEVKSSKTDVDLPIFEKINLF